MLKKYWKLFAALAVIGTAAGLIIAYFCKKKCKSSCSEDDFDSTEDEDFDLDTDLKPVSEREYVPLKKAAAPDAEADENTADIPEEETDGQKEEPAEQEPESEEA